MNKINIKNYNKLILLISIVPFLFYIFLYNYIGDIVYINSNTYFHKSLIIFIFPILLVLNYLLFEVTYNLSTKKFEKHHTNYNHYVLLKTCILMFLNINILLYLIDKMYFITVIFNIVIIIFQIIILFFIKKFKIYKTNQTTKLNKLIFICEGILLLFMILNLGLSASINIVITMTTMNILYFFINIFMNDKKTQA